MISSARLTAFLTLATKSRQSSPMLIPKALCPGDLIRVIAPSGPFEASQLELGVARLRQRYRVELGAGVQSAAALGFLAAPDAIRLRDLNEALTARDVAAIVAVRGGYGLTRITHLADWTALREQPRWLVGFSDASVLHLEALRMGVASLHAHNVTGLAQASAAAFDAWCAALESPARAAWSELRCCVPGQASGVLAGGNLSLLAFQALAGRLSLPEGSILALEDVGEAPYRIDRLLTGLEQAGALDSVAGFVLGDFVDCGPGKYGDLVEDVLLERLGRFGVPMVSGLPFGHQTRNDPLPLGRQAHLDATAGAFSVGG